MKNMSKPTSRDVAFARRFTRSQIHSELVHCFMERAKKTGLRKIDIATALNREASQISRWLAEPSNLNLDSISDLLLAMDASIEVRITPCGDQIREEFVGGVLSDSWNIAIGDPAQGTDKLIFSGVPPTSQTSGTSGLINKYEWKDTESAESAA